MAHRLPLLARALLVVSLALARPALVRAAPLEVEFDAPGAGRILTVQVQGTSYPGFVGQFEMRLDGTNGQPGPSFLSYCVDFFHNLNLGDRYPVQPRLTSDGLDPSGAIGYLYNKYGQSPLTDDQAAGLQIAIWKLQFDGNGPLDSGTFQYTAQDATAAAARNFLAEASGQGAVSAWLDAGINPDPNRPQSVLVPPNQVFPTVPEPSSFLLLALALAGLAASRSRLRPRSIRQQM